MPEFARLPEYDPLRERIKSQYSQKRSEADDALKRRLASQGMLQSGAYVKQASEQENQLGQQEAEAQQNLNLQEQAELQRRKEILEGRQFQTSERMGSQEFARGERLGGQEFAGGESALQRKFMTGEREAGQSFAAGQAKEQREWQQKEMDREFDQNVMTNYIQALVGLKDADFSDEEWIRINEKLGKLGVVPTAPRPGAKAGAQAGQPIVQPGSTDQYRADLIRNWEREMARRRGQNID